MKKNAQWSIILVIGLFMVSSCGKKGKEAEEVQEQELETKKDLTFKGAAISDSAQLWWARAIGDIDGDGILDVALQNNNGSGGWLGWLKGNADGNIWETKIIAEVSPNGNPFGAGDLEAGDIDGDGDVDVIGVEHPGEWVKSDAPAHLFWYENKGEDNWEAHTVGTIPSALKDISLADLNNDGKPEVITVTFDAKTVTIFGADGGEFKEQKAIKLENLHEGMDIGDINGDGFADIATNGYWLKNPAGDLSGDWVSYNIDEIWHNQEGDWSANATKVAVKDLNGDGKSEVFIAHSERSGYPLAIYTITDIENNTWDKKIILDSISSCHNLQIFDMDLDGDLDIVTGVNRSRAMNLGKKEYPVYVLLNQSGSWEQKLVSDQGVYNLQVGDLEGDNDFDIFRLSTHDGKDFELLVNEIN